MLVPKPARVIPAAALILSAAVCAAAKTHVIKVWGGYYQFLPARLTVALGDTIQWLPLDMPSKSHDIASTAIPQGAKPFAAPWKAPADTFFQYVPVRPGVYGYHCVPHEDHGMTGSFTVQGASGLADREPGPPAPLASRDPARGLWEFSAPYLGRPFALYDLEGRARYSGVAGRVVEVPLLPRGIYQLEVDAARRQRQAVALP